MDALSRPSPVASAASALAFAHSLMLQLLLLLHLLAANFDHRGWALPYPFSKSQSTVVKKIRVDMPST